MGSSLFNLGLSGLLASQRGLGTTGHNIANVNTPGYSRQVAQFVTRPPQGAGDGFIGTGVEVSTVRRQLDVFVNRAIQEQTAGEAQARAFLDLARAVDNLLADPSGGLSPAVQSFFGAMQELAADPSSVPARQVLLGEAEGLVQRFHQLAGRLDDLQAASDDRMRTAVAEVNSIAAEIARVNAELVREQSAFGQPANDLLDQRDELVRRLAELVDVSTFEQSDGSLNVTVGSGQGLVTGSRSATLTLVRDPFDPTRSEIGITVGGVTSSLSGLISGGEVAGLLRTRAEVLDTAQSALGHVAMGIARTVNDQHQLGQTLNGAPGGAFFRAIDQSAPVVLPAAANSGVPPGEVALSVSDLGNLPQSDYRLERSGAAHTLTRLSDGTVFDLATFPAGPEVADGLRLELSAGTIADGDSFLLQPTRSAAGAMALAISSPSEVAAAAPVRAAASLANGSSAVIASPAVNHPGNEIIITFDAPPTTFDVLDATTGAVLSSDVVYVSGAAFSFNGLTVDIAGAPAAGDVFSLTNTVAANAAGNAGTGAIGLAAVASPDPNLTDAVTITFTSASTFDVTGALTGTPTTGLTFTSGAPISFNGWTTAISGTPRAGDVFTVSANAGGVGDNRNALALAGLQTADTLDGERSTFQELYGQLVADVGTRTRQAEIEVQARGTLLGQVVNEREELSGVNLDEEAANLLRFQQAFQASAQLIAVADEIFQSLIAAVGR